MSTTTRVVVDFPFGRLVAAMMADMTDAELAAVAGMGIPKLHVTGTQFIEGNYTLESSHPPMYGLVWEKEAE